VHAGGFGREEALAAVLDYDALLATAVLAVCRFNVERTDPFSVQAAAADKRRSVLRPQPRAAVSLGLHFDIPSDVVGWVEVSVLRISMCSVAISFVSASPAYQML